MQASNAWQMACANAVGLLLVFVEQMLSSLMNNGSGGGSSIIARSTLTHLAGMGRVNLVNYSNCLHRLARVVALPVHPSNQDDNNYNGGRSEWSEGGPGTVQPAMRAAGVPTLEMACGVDPGTSVFKGSNVLANWATDICMVVGGGNGNKAGEAEDILGAITSGGGDSSAVASAWGGWRRQLTKPLPLPSPALQVSLVQHAMARLCCPCHTRC
jgi:hypothetical protein